MKILLVFSLITILTIISFSYYMYNVMSESAIQKQMDIQKNAIDRVSDYLNGKYDALQSMVREIYRDSGLAASTSYLLEHQYEDYVRYRLDRFYLENSTTDPLSFFRNKVEDDQDIRSLMLYSTDQQYLYAFNGTSFKIIPTNAARSYIPDVMYLQESSPIESANIWIRKAIDLPDVPMYAARVPINNNQTLRNIGQIMVFYDSENIWNSLELYQQDLKGSILVLSGLGDVLFDSSGTYSGQKYPYMQELDTIYDDGELGENMIVTKLTQSRAGFTVLSVVPKEELAQTYQGLGRTVLIISSICILFAILLPGLFINNFAIRTRNIIRFTRKVRNGVMTARIADTREDELGQISRSFNEMMDELNLYIERVYKAELKQKQTELVALQARINPHFLYNTLEVIRMRAVSQGAKDVGDMIYNLSVLFKSMVQQKKNYTLKDELEACRMYLELFRIRYKDRFDYAFRVEEPGLYGQPILKLSLQPIIENYIIHGMQTDRSDNRLTVEVREEHGMMKVVIQDNGKGIEPRRMAEINEQLRNVEETGDMFGLRSIHSRLRYLYRSSYGIEISGRPGEGTTVVVHYPIREGSLAESV